MLNPFRGIFCCIRYLSAEAVTADGVHWDIYVSNDALREGLDENVIVQTSDIRYGKWSLETGLRRGPMYPSEDFRRLEEMGDTVYRYLLEMHDQVPFPFADNIELWLLGEDMMPLALLDSVTREQEIPASNAGNWQCGRLCREHFSSEALLHKHDSKPPGMAAEWLTQQIGLLAGSTWHRQWIKRSQDHSGKLLGTNQTLPPQAFPLLPLRDPEDGSLVSAVIKEYFLWLAPWLLQLDSLNERQRNSLEQSAARQALLMDKLYRLYPAITDESVLQAARVEAALRNTLQPESDEQIPDNRQATYYIEPDKRPFQ